jgi:16S rRNA processing protein RimM
VTGTDQESLFPIASITRTQGLHGAVRVRVEFNDERIFEVGRTVMLSLDGNLNETTIEDFRHQHGRHVAKLASLNSISEAEEWVGAKVSIPKHNLPEAEDGTYFSFDLEGCMVYAGGEAVGTVVKVLDYGSTSLLELDRNGKEVLIPFAKAYLQRVDTAGKRIDVELPDGLLEVNE